MKTEIIAETTPIASEPSVAELDELKVCIWTGLGHPFPPFLPNEAYEEVMKAVESAYVRIYENCWMSSGYVNKVMTVLWDGEEYIFESEDVFVWKRGELTHVGRGEPYWQNDDRLWYIPAKLYNKLTNELIPQARRFIGSLFLSNNQPPF